MPKNQEEKPAEPKAERQVPTIAALASVKSWNVGPIKDAPAALTLKLVVEGFEDVPTIRALARGLAVVRIMPLQAGLPLGVPSGCDHKLIMNYTSTANVCLECGEILEIPLDDQKPAEDTKPPEEPEASSE